MSIQEKLSTIQKSVKSVKKTGYNNFQKYAYAQIQDILEALRPHLNGLTLTQSAHSGKSSIVDRSDAYYSECSVVITTTLTDTETNESVSVDALGYALDKNSDKATYKALTGGRKYGLLMLFNLDTDGDDPEKDSVPATEQQHTKTNVSSTQKKQQPSSLF